MLTKKALIFGRPFTKEFDRIYQQQGLSHGIKYFSISDFRRLNLKNNFNLIDNQYRLIKSNNVKVGSTSPIRDFTYVDDTVDAYFNVCIGILI